MQNMEWSKTEKAIVRKAFDSAYEAECQEVITELRRMVSAARKPGDVWTIREYLNRKQNDIAKKYDYRYSVLIFVLARLFKEGWIKQDALKGLRLEKIEKIKFLANELYGE